MKINTLLMSITFLVYSFAFAQLPIEIDEKVMPMSRGKQPGFEFLIHKATVSEVEKSWEKYMKSSDRPDIQTEENEIQALNATVKKISNDPVNIFAKFTELKGGAYAQVFFQYGDDFISSKNDALKFAAAKNYLHEFAKVEYKYALEEELSKEEDKYKDLEKEEKKIIKNNDDIFKTISEGEREINQLKNDIKINESDQDILVQQITKQKELVIEYTGKSEEAKKAAEKELGSFENDYKKLKKEHEKMHKKIDGIEADIRAAERNLEMSKADLSRKQDELIEQKAVIEVVKEKIRNLK